MAQLRPGAEALSMIRDEKGNAVAPLIARIKVGKGSVTFFNAERRLQKQMLEFASMWLKDKKTGKMRTGGSLVGRGQPDDVDSHFL